MRLLSEFLGGYRYVGYWDKKNRYGYQYRVHSYSEVIDFIQHYDGIENIGITMTTYIKDLPYLIWLPMDFDSPDLRKSWDEAKTVYNFLVDCDYDVGISYTGGRGFHIFLSVVPDIYTRDQIKTAQLYFKDLFELEYIDTNIMGDYRRLMRIPCTVHFSGIRGLWLKYNPGRRFDIDEYFPDDKSIVTSNKNNFSDDVDYKYYHKYPCVENLITDFDYWHERHPRGDFEPHWMIRFGWVVSRLAQGWTDEEIIEEGRTFGWNDWNESKTLYYINHIASKGYAHPSCDTYRDLGFCDPECKFNLEWNVPSVKEYRE